MGSLLPLLVFIGCSAPHASTTPDNGAGGSSAIAEGSSSVDATSTAGRSNDRTTGTWAAGGATASLRGTSMGGSGAQSSGASSSVAPRGGSVGTTKTRASSTNASPQSNGGTRASSAGVASGGSGSDHGTHDHGTNDHGSGGDPVTTSQTERIQPHDHCVDGEHADPRDGQLTGEPERWVSGNGAVDLVLPKAVLTWMTERIWQPSHDAWHNVRRCDSGAPLIGGGVNAVCTHSELIPDHQECEDAEDGYQFLVMHRHMIQSLRQAFPQHAALFDGFPSFPSQASDVPAAWQDRFGTGWTQEVKDTAQLLESIEGNLGQFATEGDLGKYIQCGKGASGATSIHGALHFKWVVNDSPHSLGKQPVNIENYMFWKLHGWIDDIWERYRQAKGLAPDEAKLKQALTAQCREMHALGIVVGPDAGSPSSEPLPTEHGYFHDEVRPILERNCSGCHGESSPQAGLPLGGHISSADIVKALLDAPSMYGGQFKRVVAGSPDESWFYLKPAGLAAAAGCTASSCNTQVMPPTGKVTLTNSELGILRQWIVDGAAPPTP